MSLPLSTREQLRAFVARVERLNEEIVALNADKREVYAEAKAMGFDPKVIKAAIKIRAQNTEEMQEFEAVLATYLHALDDAGTLVATRAGAQNTAGFPPGGQEAGSRPEPCPPSGAPASTPSDLGAPSHPQRAETAAVSEAASPATAPAANPSDELELPDFLRRQAQEA